VYESFGLGSDLMAELCAPIPDTSVTSASVQLEQLEFSSDLRQQHSHAAVGSGRFLHTNTTKNLVQQ